MGWQASNLSILTLETVGSADNSAMQSDKVTRFTDFKAKGKAFPANGARLVFIHAHCATNNFKQWHVIPCDDVQVKLVDPAQGLQEISFKASLQERRSGSYHLVAWRPPPKEDGSLLYNEVATLENAFTLHKATDAETEANLTKVRLLEPE